MYYKVINQEKITGNILDRTRGEQPFVVNIYVRTGRKKRKEKKKNEQARIEKGIIPYIFAYTSPSPSDVVYHIDKKKKINFSYKTDLTYEREKKKEWPRENREENNPILYSLTYSLCHVYESIYNRVQK